MTHTSRTTTLVALSALAALGACTDGNKANEDARQATGDSSAAGYAAPGTGGALSDTTKPAPGSGTGDTTHHPDTTRRP